MTRTTDEVKMCCGAKLIRTTKGIGDLVERYECAKCGGTYSPYLSTIYSKGGKNHIKYEDIKLKDIKLEDYLMGGITWFKEITDD